MSSPGDRMRVLLVEDDPAMRRLLESQLQCRGHAVTACADGETAWKFFQQESNPLVVMDLNLPGMDGLELSRKIRSLPQGRYCTILVVTGRDTPDDLQSVLSAGADDYIAKPIDTKLLNVRLAIAERRARDLSALLSANDRITLLEEQSKTRTTFQGFIGKSDSIQEVFKRVRLAAESHVTVLVLGESGTGKELAARAIHSLSARRDKPFIGINCSAIPEPLLESELFGHVKGAFTGAVRDKTGLFQAASGGTLFLDEVGDMDQHLQVKLLRALQEQEIQRVGDPHPTKVDVRLITATNKDPAKLLAAGAIREDFYYRIRVFEIFLPPLRDRREDIPLLVERFISEFSGQFEKKVGGVTHDAMKCLMEHEWPGNVRELRNVIERAFVALDSDEIELKDLPKEISSLPPVSGDSWSEEDQQERSRIIDALRTHGGNQSKAAKSLGISRVTIWKKIRQFNIEVKSEKS